MTKFLKKLFCKCKDIEITEHSRILATSVCKKCGKKRLHNFKERTCLVLNNKEYEQAKKDVKFLREL